MLVYTLKLIAAEANRNLDNELYDLLIIGGGINGVGIARDAAGRGLKVLLCEQNDLASGTSSASTKLIHGGLRYLEHFEFRLVREALQEREILYRSAPHIIQPLSFILPHHRELRPAWLLRFGLFLYDHLGGRQLLSSSRQLDLRQDSRGEPLAAKFSKGFEYTDCWVDDARLVVLNAIDAREKGALIKTRSGCTALATEGSHWCAKLGGVEPLSIHARAIVNAAGPWVQSVQRLSGAQEQQSLHLVKGSHIVTHRLFAGDHAYIFQHGDGRVIFAIPFATDYTLIGTTEVTFTGDPGQANITQEEIDYLCTAVSAYLKNPVTAEQVLWHYSGVRPLYSDKIHDDKTKNNTAISRDYRLELDTRNGPPRLTVYGGKLTTYRKLAEQVLATLQPVLGFSGEPWTQQAALPGGEMPVNDFATFCSVTQQQYAWLEHATVQRLCHSYGTRIEQLLGDARSLADLGTHFGGGLYEAELIYLKEFEWAWSAEDVLWRRSKLGLLLDANEQQAVDSWFSGKA